jgi:DNA-directed RNA polymerase subunit RPC12/RpoP
MPVYVYQCNACSSNYTEAEADAMSEEEYGEKLLFETFHTMNPSEEQLKEAVLCPRCNSGDCDKTFVGVNISSYIRGYGWKDKAGSKRDMHVYHLDNQDPYSKHRVPGEVEHVRRGLKDQGKHDPNTKYFTQKTASEPFKPSDVPKSGEK